MKIKRHAGSKLQEGMIIDCEIYDEDELRLDALPIVLTMEGDFFELNTLNVFWIESLLTNQEMGA